MRRRIEGHTQEQLIPEARDILFQVAEILTAVLLQVDAASDGDPVVAEICKRHWAKTQIAVASKTTVALPRDPAALKAELKKNQTIVFGSSGLDPNGDNREPDSKL